MMRNETPKRGGLKPPACVMLTGFVGEEFGQSTNGKACLHDVSAASASMEGSRQSPEKLALQPFRAFLTQREGHRTLLSTGAVP